MATFRLARPCLPDLEAACGRGHHPFDSSIIVRSVWWVTEERPYEIACPDHPTHKCGCMLTTVVAQTVAAAFRKGTESGFPRWRIYSPLSSEPDDQRARNRSPASGLSSRSLHPYRAQPLWSRSSLPLHRRSRSHGSLNAYDPRCRPPCRH